MSPSRLLRGRMARPARLCDGSPLQHQGERTLGAEEVEPALTNLGVVAAVDGDPAIRQRAHLGQVPLMLWLVEKLLAKGYVSSSVIVYGPCGVDVEQFTKVRRKSSNEVT